MWCIVNLPNGTQLAVECDSKAIGQECLEKVCRALNIICEMQYLGLKHWSPNQPEGQSRQWINLRNRLTCDGSRGFQLTLSLQVKFWVPVHDILQESMRNIFYMQAKKDLLEGHLKARDWKNAAKLAALLCQADRVRFNEAALKSVYPLRLQKEQNHLQTQEQQHQQQLHQCQKERKEKENILHFKKRRLSKQKSIENIDNPVYTRYPCTSSSTAITTPTQALSTHQLPLNGASESLQSSSVFSMNVVDCAKSICTYGSAKEEELSLSTSPLQVYQDYLISPCADLNAQVPEDILYQIAVEHGKLSTLKMKPQSAKYWLLREIQDLPGYGEELFSGAFLTENVVRCSVAVGAYGITVYTGDEKNNIPFSAITAAKASGRTFKLEYLNDHHEPTDFELKLQKDAVAEGLYRSITERHAFYICDKVRGVVTNQFKRGFKGTIASMFKEDTELGKRYVFDVQHTCREVHDHARRTLHENGIEITSQSARNNDSASALVSEDGSTICETEFSFAEKLEKALREKAEREAVIESCVDARISEAMTCKICMDHPINTMFSPCCHVMACGACAVRCTKCPSCRENIVSAVKIFLPPELRKSQPSKEEKCNLSSNKTESSNLVGEQAEVLATS